MIDNGPMYLQLISKKVLVFALSTKFSGWDEKRNFSALSLGQRRAGGKSPFTVRLQMPDLPRHL
jgi:hypothetical protein